LDLHAKLEKKRVKPLPQEFTEELKSLTKDNQFRIVSVRFRLARNLRVGAFPYFDSQIKKLESLLSPLGIPVEKNRTLGQGLGQYRLYFGSEDHIRFEWVVVSTDLSVSSKAIFAQLERVRDLFFQPHLWAYKRGLGFINSCPTNWGRGDRISAIIEIQSHNFFPILSKLSKLNEFGIEFAPLSDGLKEEGVQKKLGVLTKISVKNARPVQKREFFKILSLLTLLKTSTV
jgi:protein-arginine kinase